MPILSAAKKALRQSTKKQFRNNLVRNEISYLSRMVRKSLDKKDANAAKDFAQQAIKKIDKGTKTGILKPNTAGRKKSVLMRSLDEK